jgi:hypothetical protein
MLVPLSNVFTDLNQSTTPAILHGAYSPTTDYDETLLAGAAPGTIYAQLDQDCSSGCEFVALWAKRTKGLSPDAYDWQRINTTVIRGAGAPSASTAALCAAPLGSVYIDEDGSGCVEQFYIKIGDTCNAVASCPDWWPVVLRVTRTGNTFSFDTATYTLNIPIGGKLANNGNFSYTWTPDDGGSGYTFYLGEVEAASGTQFHWEPHDGGSLITWYIPTLATASAGVFTWNPNNGGSTITIDTTAWTTKDRPWSEVGQAQATNNSSIQSADGIYHEGLVVIGGTTQDIPGSKLEVIGNFGSGGATNTLGNSTNSVVHGIANTLGGTDASVIAGGTTNVINGAADANYDANFIGAGGTNTLAGGYSGIVAGQGNDITNTSNGFIGAGADNLVSGASSGVVSGANNTASGQASFVGAGQNNTASGANAQVLGVRYANATAAGGVAIGTKINNTHTYAVLISADSTGDPNVAGDEFASAASGEFAVRAPGGVRIITSDYNDVLAGVGLDADDTSWNVLSDERLKTGIIEVEGRALEGYDEVKVYQYTIGSENTTIGLLAQEFYRAFGHLLPRTRETHDGYLVINQGERDAIQDMAIKDLLAEVDALRNQMSYLQERIAEFSGD